MPRIKTHYHQYLAAGDARVANWPRAMIQIEGVGKSVYLFRISKRGHRAGWTDEKGNPTEVLYFRRSGRTEPIRWYDATAEEAERSAWIENYRCLTAILPTPLQKPICRARVRHLAKRKFDVGKDKADQWLKLCISDGIVDTVQERNENARIETLFKLKEVAP